MRGTWRAKESLVHMQRRRQLQKSDTSQLRAAQGSGVTSGALV